jgi:hypothetical protein
MRKKHHKCPPEEKVSILCRHLVEHITESDLFDEYHLQPRIFYTWQKQFLRTELLLLFVTADIKHVSRKSSSSNLMPS